MVANMRERQIDTQQEKSKIIDSFAQDLPQPDFAKLIMSHISAWDLQSLSLSEVKAITDKMWNLFSQKKDVFSLNIFDTYSSDSAREYTVLTILNKDKPFLVDSIVNALSHFDVTINLLLHPIVVAKRDKKNYLETFSAAGPESEKGSQESLIIVCLQEKLDAQEKKAVTSEIVDVLEDVRLAVDDWLLCRKKITEVINNFALAHTKDITPEDKKEIIAFLEWMESGFFTLLGAQEFDLTNTKDTIPKVIHQLGICKRATANFYCDIMDEACERYLPCDEIFKITKTVQRSKVHRIAPMDVIRIKKFDAKGVVVGEYEFFGLFTSSAYNYSIRNVPILRQKLSYVLEASKLSSEWHDGKALVHIMETYPRDELFQVEKDKILESTQKILELQDRPNLSSLIRRDTLGHMITCIIYVPRERYTGDFLGQINEILSSEFNGRITYFQPHVNTDSYYARLHYTIAVHPRRHLNFHEQSLENILKSASLRWVDHLKEAFIKKYAPDKISTLRRQFLNAFPVQYQQKFSIDTALIDIQIIQKVLDDSMPAVGLHKVINKKNTLNLKLYHKNDPVPLYDIIPILENMGTKVRTELHYPIKDGLTHEVVYIHDFELESAFAQEEDFGKLKNVFEESLLKIYYQDVENDEFNKLILSGAMHWKRVILLRAYYKYLKQLDFTYSQVFVANCLADHPDITNHLIDFFSKTFNREEISSAKEMSDLLEKIDSLLDDVKGADEDKILRQYLNLILATIRTNYFQMGTEDTLPNYVVFKFDCRLVQNMPKPKPMFEMFIYAVDFEAIHLRTGKVARGGLRWSDRQEDFRKEVLGLMKAQRVKNAVIVPVGAKGGFVIKKNMSNFTQEEKGAMGVACYKKMIQAMLDISDNLENGEIVKPKNVHCLDGDDAYLVVAADKGTATFSDIANDIAVQNKFWLGDAFASGGSVGYDHKKMGITARGAWESVKRHFREMGINIQTTPFTVIGIGDMSGDVFGNGMLLSKHIKLIGAFNHLHIFVDPTPDPVTSYKERERLFNLPRSSWNNYNKNYISKGGCVFNRSDKTIELSPEIQKLYKLKKNKVTPDDLIKAMLSAQTDLLWFGGIGTYIKSKNQTNSDVGDRANDSIRMNGIDIQAKVIGEGANLGVTQQGRIEYALSGGRINTDAIDNSGGVDCSDHEVNIKILLDNALERKKISKENRNKTLSDMSDEVAALVLRDNYLQSQAISVMQHRSYHVLDRHDRLMKHLEKNGALDRQVEFLPSDDEMRDRLLNNRGLTRPELAVLLAYGKIFVYENILQSTLPDDPGLLDILTQYFPKVLNEKFAQFVQNHPLKREIIATHAANSLVNRMGATFFNEMMGRTGAEASDVIRAYLSTRNCLDVRQYWHAIEVLDNKINAKIQLSMMLKVVELMDASTLWFLAKHKKKSSIAKMVDHYYQGMQNFSKEMSSFIIGDNKKFIKKQMDKLKKEHVPEKLAFQIATLPHMIFSWDIIDLAHTTKHDVKEIGCLFFDLGQRFSIDWLRYKMDETPTGDPWKKKALENLKQDLHRMQVDLTHSILLGHKKGEKAKGMLHSWLKEKTHKCQELDKMFVDMKAAGIPDLAILSVATRKLEILL